MDYHHGGFENPPMVAEASALESHTLATEEFEDLAVSKKNDQKRNQMTIKQAIMASKVEKSDGKINFTAKSLFEIVMYAMFLVVLVLTAFANHSVQTYYYTQVMGDLFVRSQQDTGVTFTDVSTIDMIWDYMTQQLMWGLYWDEANSTNTEQSMVYFENKLLGAPRIRMLKVENTSCTVVESFSREIKECFSNYDPDKEDKLPFAIDNPAFVYTSAKDLEVEPLKGTVAEYSGGGFTQFLPLDDADQAQAEIAILKANRWIDRGARAVIIQFNLYNANVNLFCAVSLIFELPATGGVIPISKFNSMKLIRYYGTWGTILMFLEGIFVGFIAFFLFEEIFEVLRIRLGYFASFWNLFDVVLLAFSILSIVFSIQATNIATKRINKVLNNGLTSASFDDAVDSQSKYNNMVAIVLFLAWIKVFKYISVNKTMSQLSATLSRSSKDIGGFAVMFAVFFFAFAQFAYLVFGTQIADYSTFYDAVFALLRTILGDFDFHALENANRILGPLFFITYVFFVFFVLLNMFLAIINDSYVEVKAELARQKDGISVFDWVKNKLNALKRGQQQNGGNGEITYNLYREEMLMKGIPEELIEEAYQKHHIERNDVVNDKMMNDLGIELEKMQDNNKKISNEYKDFVVLNRRVDQIESSIVGVIDRVDAVLNRLCEIENDKVRVKEHENRINSERFWRDQHDADIRQRQRRAD